MRKANTPTPADKERRTSTAIERADDAAPDPSVVPFEEGRGAEEEVEILVELVVGRIVEGRGVVVVKVSVGVDDTSFMFVVRVGIDEMSFIVVSVEVGGRTVGVDEDPIMVLAGGEVALESDGERHPGALEASR